MILILLSLIGPFLMTIIQDILSLLFQFLIQLFSKLQLKTIDLIYLFISLMNLCLNISEFV